MLFCLYGAPTRTNFELGKIEIFDCEILFWQLKLSPLCDALFPFIASDLDLGLYYPLGVARWVMELGYGLNFLHSLEEGKLQGYLLSRY